MSARRDDPIDMAALRAAISAVKKTKPVEEEKPAVQHIPEKKTRGNPLIDQGRKGDLGALKRSADDVTGAGAGGSTRVTVISPRRGEGGFGRESVDSRELAARGSTPPPSLAEDLAKAFAALPKGPEGIEW